nr:GntR family transcriptional regulator [uncultured Dyadobacter sp.]
MESIFDKIRELREVTSYSKHDQIVVGIINAIDQKIVAPNDLLPSVNQMIQELSFSRETIRKGYGDLVDRGVVESKNRIGYYVTNAQTDQFMKVALLMYNLDTFEELFYRNFRKELGKKVHLDVFFHHGSIDFLESTLFQIKGKYGMYVVAPIPHRKTREILETIPRANLMIFDRFEPLDGDVNYIAQEFEKSTYSVLETLADRIREFDEIIFYHSPKSLDPKEIVFAFKRFLHDHSVRGQIISEFVPGSVEKGKAYFTLDNFTMWSILKECKSKKLTMGTDVGLLSVNDEPAKEFVDITTYSTDFALMGKLAGQAIMQKQQIRVILPNVLIRRKTL